MPQALTLSRRPERRNYVAPDVPVLTGIERRKLSGAPLGECDLRHVPIARFVEPHVADRSWKGLLSQHGLEPAEFGRTGLINRLRQHLNGRVSIERVALRP